MTSVQGIIEVALSVESVEHSAEFYRRLFGFGTLLQSERLAVLEAREAHH